MDYQISSRLSVGPIESYLKKVPKSSFEGNILILTSPSVEKIEIVRKSIDMIKSLPQVIKFNLFHISPEAPLEELDNIINTQSKPDHIIAIGGGSVVDASKALSLAWDGITVSDLFYKKKVTIEKKIWVTAIPSTAGTGAELSHGAIVYDRSTSKKGGIRGKELKPDAVLLDARIHKHAPPRLIGETGFDCLTHAIETYCSKAGNALVRYQSIKALDTVFKNLKQAVNGQIEALEKMAIAASFMGVNLAYSRTCLPHRIQYVIGPFTNTSHAQGLIMLYRGWLPKISKEKIFEQMASDLKMNADELVSKIRDLKEDLEIDYKLRQFGVSNENVERLAGNVSGTVELDPCYRNLNTIKQIISDSI